MTFSRPWDNCPRSYRDIKTYRSEFSSHRWSISSCPTSKDKTKMSSERCGLGSLLPTSCRGRAEAFARRLQCRLRSLGRGTDEEEPGTSNTPGTNEYDELLDSESWKPNSSTTNNMQEKQPIVSPNSDRFYDFDIDSNPGSPVNEEVIDVNNTDGLCESGCILASPSSADIDSDNSDVQYYDPAWSEVFADAFSAIVPQSNNNNNNIHIKTESISSTDTIISQNSVIINNDNESQNIENESIRKCIEQLCNDIIKEAEIEVSKIKLQAQEKSPPISVIISKADSIDIKPECSNISNIDEVIKSKDEISTLFDSLTLREPVDDSQLSTPEEDFPRRVQRSSSLKSGKTPPGTPGRKKIVRFADVLGLDLADVRTYMDEIPRVPRSAFDDLTDLSRKSEVTKIIPSKCLVPMFQQPGGNVDFLEKVRSNKVCLENAFQSDSLSISGTVRVLNLEFHKSVHIRYTLDNWENFADLQATHVPCTSDFFSDKFSFVLYAHTLDIGQRIEFAIKYTSAGQQYWDSNGGVNYIFQCLNSTVPITQTNIIANRDSNSPEDDSWASFY